MSALPMNCLNLCLPEFFRASSVFRHFQIKSTQHLGRRRVREKCNLLFRMLMVEFQLSNSPEGVFRGGAAQALWNHIARHYNCQHSHVYAHYTAIVQSSGMGKSMSLEKPTLSY